MNITIISSSPRKESVSNRIALFLEKRLAAEVSHTIRLVDVRDWLGWDVGQPVYKSIDACPESFRPLAEIMFSTDAFVIVSPEYNGGMPYSLKKLFDFFPKQSHKVFAIATSSTGAMGGMRASLAIQHFVVALFGIVSPYMLITPKVTEKFDESGNLLDESFQKNIDTFLNEFRWLLDKVGHTG